MDLLCATAAPKVREGKLRARAQEICAASPGKAALSALAPFEVTLESFVEARTAARDAVLDLDLTPTSPAEQDAAARKATEALTSATRLAQKLVAGAHAAAGDLEHLVQNAEFLRAAVSLPATEEAARLHLGRFSANGIFGAPDVYVVHVLKRPSQFLLDEGSAEAAAEKPEEREILVDRFQPASRNYVDIGLAVMYSAGLPDHPALAGQLGKQQLVQQQTAGFNGGVLVSLEPLEFTRIADPWAQLLHFPTIIIPFTIDPTHNYFIGAGLGIFDVASIDVGAHLSLTRVPAPGNSYGETFTTSPIDINHVTQAGPIAGGYFVSLSVDLVGVVHLIVDQLKPTVRDVQSNEPVGQVKP